MLERLPEYVDPLQLADSRRLLTGRVALADMQRLAPSLYSTEGSATVDLEFGKDEQHIPYLRGHITAQVTVLCQPCLQPMVLDLHTEPCLGMVKSEGQAETLPENYEPLWVNAPVMPLAAIVEDELLLALPSVPKHADINCAAHIARPAEPETATRKNPFELLAQL